MNLQPTFNLLDQAILRRMQSRRTPGAALALFNREQCVHVGAFGVTDLHTLNPITSDTLFSIGSITKTFMAVATMQATERGLLNLHAPITDYLPWFQVRSTYSPITLHHLLTHSAGLVCVIDRAPDPHSAVYALRETEAAWPPGAHFHYSDAGYQTLGLVLEQVMGRPFHEIIQTNVFAPLGMAASEPALTHAIWPRIAKGYTSLYDDRPPHSSHPLVPAAWIETNAADCCIASTAGDMARLGRMLLNEGRPLLPTASYRLLVDQAIPTHWGFDYGYGLMIHRREEALYIGHGGGMPGYEAHLLLNSDHGLGVALLSSKPSIGVGNLARTILDVWRQAKLGNPPNVVDLSSPNPTRVQEAADYAGTFHDGKRTLVFTAASEHLILYHRDNQTVLEQRGEDTFYAPRPDFDRFLLAFGRQETVDGSPGQVVEVCYGPDRYVNESYTEPTTFSFPSAWDAYPGHYRAHIPWQTNFRIILRKGHLYLVWPEGNQEPLTPLEEAVFRVGDEPSPERLRFSQVINNQATCATYSGSDFYRFFTP